MSVLSRWAGSAMTRLVRHRGRLPAFMNRAIDSVAKNPDGPLARLADALLGSGATVPAATSVPETAVRVYIGPTNYAAQGYLWARALEGSGAGIGARNMAVELPGGFEFPADSVVPISVYNRSRLWQSAELARVLDFTHVLFEAERPLFGSLLGRDLDREQHRLHSAGVSTAFMSHGTDIRSPRRHAGLTPWSPFGHGDDHQERALQRDADANIELLVNSGRPVFVSTPDLLLDAPFATWCPVVVDASRWQGGRELFSAPVPIVTHIPSMGPVKGTQLIEPVLVELHDQGVIEYRPLTGVSSAQMPGHIGDADIVLDQFRIGSYGVAAVEAMAAGRIVVGHVLPQVRDSVLAASGRALPIVEADPSTLRAVLLSLLADRDSAVATSVAGAQFAHSTHSGEYSAKILHQRWISQSQSSLRSPSLG